MGEAGQAAVGGESLQDVFTADQEDRLAAEPLLQLLLTHWKKLER